MKLWIHVMISQISSHRLKCLSTRRAEEFSTGLTCGCVLILIRTAAIDLLASCTGKHRTHHGILVIVLQSWKSLTDAEVGEGTCQIRRSAVVDFAAARIPTHQQVSTGFNNLSAIH
jgi:hypothetical protein